MNLSKPPAVPEVPSNRILALLASDKKLLEDIYTSIHRYDYWDKIKQKYLRSNYNPEDVWQALKFLRKISHRPLPFRDKYNKPFSYYLTNKMEASKQIIDSKASGKLKVPGKIDLDRQKYQISSLVEEAIASSQLEGASTTRKVAKQMITSGRKPSNVSERMILNNYQTMESIIKWSKMPLSREMLLEIQTSLTHSTLEEIEDVGRFRTDSDNIAVYDQEQIVYEPPKVIAMDKAIDALIEFANSEQSPETYLHPVVKASILHFWLAIIHPFCDGNGRTARAVFYWYLLKEDYWLFKYLSISLVIKQTKKQYDEAFLKVQYDQNDWGYFLDYSFRTIEKSIELFEKHLAKWVEKNKILQSKSKKLSKYNQRQQELLGYLYEHPDSEITITTHRKNHGVAYQTARTDLMELEEKKLIYEADRKRKAKIYKGNTNKIESIFM